MPRAGHYLVEFEFWSDADQLYWLPLFIHAESLPDAEAYAAPIKAGLLANYQVLRESRVAVVTSGLTSDTIAEYRKSCAIGVLALLNTKLWTVRSIREAPRVDFQAQTTAEIEKLLPHLEVATSLSQKMHRRFSVNLIANPGVVIDDLLLINVVGPSE